MNRRGEETRNQIMDAAARLFAEQGVDAVTMAEIHEATGQRNKSAIQYHFGSRRGLVVAIIERRKELADEIRAPMLAGTAEDDLAGLVRAMVLPAMPNLDTEQGRYYLRIVSPFMERF
ncbi:MAG: helix-turn-helix domain-containing protein, partial [Actinomycetota bacterium]